MLGIVVSPANDVLYDLLFGLLEGLEFSTNSCE